MLRTLLTSWLILGIAVGSAAAEGPSVAEAPLSLPQLLAEVRRVNPEILAARKRWEAAQAKIPQATGLPAPKIGVEWEEIPRGTVKLNQATAMYQLLQSLPFPGKLSARRQVAVAEAQVAAAKFKQAEWDVLRHVKETYYHLFQLDRELEIAQEQSLWLDQVAAAAEARYAAGAASQPEVLRAQAEALGASNQRTVLTHRHLAMVAHMNHLLDRPGHASVGHPGPIPLTPVPSDPDALLALAQGHQPELLMFKFAAERAEAAWRLSKRELWPDLETMLELRDPAMGPIGPWDLTLALVLPFWFWTKQRYGVTVALRDRESAEAAYRFMRNELVARIHEHWHEAQAAYATAALCQDGVIPLSRQAVASALAAYQGGRGTFSDVLEALRALGERERTYYEHLVALEQHLVMLEQSVGVPLRAAHEDAQAGGTS